MVFPIFGYSDETEKILNSKHGFGWKVTTTTRYLDDPDTEQEIDDEGYVVIPPRKEKQPKGVKCGECGAKFENGKPYSYSCQRSNCPIQTRNISWI